MTRIGETLAGRYQLQYLLGVGGFGAVFRAIHVDLGTPFAVKIFHARLVQEKDHVARFLREARTAASLQHPGIVRTTDFGWLDDGTPFLVMELVQGESFGTLFRRQDMPLETIAVLLSQVLSALASAHAAGVVHRDLKPENVLCFRDEKGKLRAKLADFGLAKPVASDSLEGITSSGSFLGTPRYASPEQLENTKKADARSDVYSMGAMAFYLLTRQHSHQSSSDSEALARVVRGQIERHPAALRKDVPAWLDAAVAKALELAPKDRFQDAGQMLAAFEASDTEETVDMGTRAAPKSRGIWLWLAGGLVVLALALAWIGLPGQTAKVVLPQPLAPRPASDMIPLRGGAFSMGSSPEDVEQAFRWCLALTPSGCARSIYERELPAHAVSVSAFAIDVAEVSNEDFSAFLDHLKGLELKEERIVSWQGRPLADLKQDYSGLERVNGHFRPRQGREGLPVVQVSWFGADEFCRERGKRLPTEAEWEFAARGDAGRRFPWGSSEPNCAGVAFGRGPDQPCAGGQKGPSPTKEPTSDMTPDGVRDMGGNVSEWVADDFVPGYKSCSGACADPLVSTQAPFKVCRGGNWGQLAEMTRAAGRGRLAPGETSTQIGFRCAKGE